MVRNIVVLGGSSHPQLNETVSNHLGIPPSNILLSKFSVGETRVEIKESVRGKDVFIIQSGGGNVNDHLVELLITISACKTASAKKVTAVLPLFPYSRQSDIPYNKMGAPLARSATGTNKPEHYTFESRPQTPHPAQPESAGLTNSVDSLQKRLTKSMLEDSNGSSITPQKARFPNGAPRRSDTLDSKHSDNGRGPSSGEYLTSSPTQQSATEEVNGVNGISAFSGSKSSSLFQPQPGYKQWVAQAGTLVADLLTCAGADHIITMDLHDPQYQGFFDIPVDNLYGRPLLKKYIQYSIPDYKGAVVVSPDAGGAKRATAIADGLEMDFALIHKVSLASSAHLESCP
jgi:ribose-phosphate pyrophosphokinase